MVPAAWGCLPKEGECEDTWLGRGRRNEKEKCGVGAGQRSEELEKGPPKMYLCESEFRSEKSFPKKQVTHSTHAPSLQALVPKLFLFYSNNNKSNTYTS